jgi:hypothetical protein
MRAIGPQGDQSAEAQEDDACENDKHRNRALPVKRLAERHDSDDRCKYD